MTDPVRLTVTDIAFGGSGVARHDGKVWFVPFTAPSDVIEAVAVKERKRMVEGKLIRIIEPSPARVTPRCPYYGRCGGCQYQHIHYDTQLSLKLKQWQDHLERIAHLSPPPPITVLPSKEIYAYRSRITLHADPEPSMVGVDPGERIPVDHCAIAHDIINQNITEATGQGRVQLTALSGDECAVIPCQSENPGYTASTVNDVTYAVPLHSFSQVNPSILPGFIEWLRARANGSSCTTLIDAYCGYGLFTLQLHDLFEKVTGLELDKEAVQAARTSSRGLGADHIHWQRGRVEKTLPHMLQNTNAAETFLLLDPPRAGLPEDIRTRLCSSGPAAICFISCNPPRLARDLKHLSAAYTCTDMLLLDMFPQTAHIEVAVMLEKRKR